MTKKYLSREALGIIMFPFILLGVLYLVSKMGIVNYTLEAKNIFSQYTILFTVAGMITLLITYHFIYKRKR